MISDGGFAQCPLRLGASKCNLLVPEDPSANMAPRSSHELGNPKELIKNGKTYVFPKDQTLQWKTIFT